MSVGSTPTPPAAPPPPPSPPPEAPRRDRRTLIAAVAGAGMGVIVLLVLALMFRGSDTDDAGPSPTAPGASGPTTQPTSAPTTTQPTTQPTEAPPGETLQLPAGISVLVPAGWDDHGYIEGSPMASLSDDAGNSVVIIGGVGDEPSDAMENLTSFQTQMLSVASYSDVQVTGPVSLDVVSPITSHAQLTFTLNWTDVQGRVFPREGRMDAVSRGDGGVMYLMIESKGGELGANESRWGPIVDSALQSFAAAG